MLKDWTKFEKLLLCGSISVITVLAIIFKSNVLTTVASIFGVLTALFIVKGKTIGQAFGVASAILYSILSFRNKFYGEVIIYLSLILPLNVMGVISWIKHQSKSTNTVEVNKVSKKEWILLSITSVFVFIGLYFLLKYFNTEELIVSTISVISSLYAIYLQVRRSRYSFYFYIANDIVLFVLWGIPVIKGSLLLLPMLVNPVINFINDSYGVYNWKKLEEKQKN